MILVMTETERRNGEWTTISVKKSTLTGLAELMPKSWDWDRCILELKEMWAEQQGKVIRTGKPSQNNQTS
jgi:hypothetical protein